MSLSPRRLPNPPLISALAALAIYVITLNGVFIYDDVAILQTDKRIADPRLWVQYWTDSYNFGVDNLYRPLVSMSYAVQYYVHGPRPMPFHLVNWILHALASALVAMFAMKLAARCEIDYKSGRAIGLIAGVLFAVHPVHVEAVANVVGRAEMMCALGAVGAMLLFLRPLTNATMIAIYSCFVLALLSKEQGLLVPLLLGALWLVLRGPAEAAAVENDAMTTESAMSASVQALDYRRPDPGRSQVGAVLFLLLALTLAGYVVYRESILKFWWDKNFLDTWIQPLAAPGVTMTDRLLVPITLMGRYLQLLVAPIILRLDYGGLIVPGHFDSSDPHFYLGIGAIVLWLALLGIALKQRDRFSILCLLCFAFIYGLLGNIVTIIGVNMAERLMYLPSVFFVLILARWLTRLDRRAGTSIAIVIALAFSLRTFTYAKQWNDRLGFYVYSARVEPRSLKATQLAMQEYMDRGNLDEAERFARAAIAIKPDSDDTYLRLAMVKIERGEFDEAERLIDKAQQLNPPGKAGVYRDTLNERRAATRPTSR